MFKRLFVCVSPRFAFFKFYVCSYNCYLEIALHNLLYNYQNYSQLVYVEWTLHEDQIYVIYLFLF